MQNGHARRLPATFLAVLACDGVSEGGMLGLAKKIAGDKRKTSWGKMEDWREGTVCLEQFADRIRCLAAKNSERSE